MLFLLNIIKKTLLASVFFTFLISFFFIYFLWKFTPELPSYNELKNYNPDLTSRVFTSDGVLLDKYYTQERIFVPIDRIPKKLINAFISAEDKNFYNHFGIDVLAIFRASFTNVINKAKNKKMIGASTITQQVVKNLLLTNEVSFERKFKEIILAIRIENILTKDQILELYLNDIYLGFRSYGVASASLNYFNKSLNDLSIDEGAFIASLPKAPNNYNPITKYNNAINRRNWVLRKMIKNKYLDKQDISLLEKPIIIFERKEKKFSAADYFKEEIRKELYNILGPESLYKDGLIVKSSIDTKLQKTLDKILKEGLISQDKKGGWRGALLNTKLSISSKKFKENILNPFPNKWFLGQVKKKSELFISIKDKENNSYNINLNSTHNNWLLDEDFFIGDIVFLEKINKDLILRQIPLVNGAIVAIDPHTGKVLGLSGGFSFQLSQFNRATQAKRQSGSAFKPFVYISAIKEGYNPSTLILDAPYVIDQGPGLPKWKPSNYTDKFYGLSTMRTGIEKSRNLMTIRLADKIGMLKIINTAKDFKIHKYMDDNLSMSLGAGLTTLIDLTNAYAMIVNGGNEITPTLITSVNDRSGKQIINNENKKCLNCKQINQILDFKLPKVINNRNSILDSRIAFQVTSMLEGVVLRGTGKKISSLNIPLAGKTGTTNDNKDAWFVGFSPDLAVGVYVGYDMPKSLGFKQTGSAVAVPIFKNFMKEFNVNINKIPFRIPSGLSFVNIDPRTGLITKDPKGIQEPFFLGDEPYNKNLVKQLDSLGSINNDSISGTGSLLIQ